MYDVISFCPFVLVAYLEIISVRMTSEAPRTTPGASVTTLEAPGMQKTLTQHQRLQGISEYCSGDHGDSGKDS